VTERRCWTVGEVFAVVLGNLIAISLAAAGWAGVSGEILVSRQLPWAALAGGAVVVAGAVNAGWLLTGRRAVAERQAATLGRKLPAVLALLPSETSPAEPSTDEPVAGPGMTRFHDPRCLLTIGKDTAAAPVAVHRRAGRRPCELCAPPTATSEPDPGLVLSVEGAGHA
jgi:hypothetical protein